MEIIEIIDKIKKEYSEIDWGNKNNGYGYNDHNRIISRYNSEELKEKFNNRKNQRFLLIQYFTKLAINWRNKLQGYFTITEITSKPSTGNLELTKNGKLDEIISNLDKDYFTIDQDFF